MRRFDFVDAIILGMGSLFLVSVAGGVLLLRALREVEMSDQLKESSPVFVPYPSTVVGGPRALEPGPRDFNLYCQFCGDVFLAEDGHPLYHADLQSDTL